MLDALSNSDSRFLRNLSKIGERMQRAEDQLSSGLRVKTASDAPDQISSLLQLRAQLASNDQVQSNLGRMKTEVDTAESAMQEAVSILEKIKTLGAQGANSNQTPEARKTLAEDIEAQLQNLVGLTNTKVDGRYVFSGDSDSVAPYALDLTVNPPVSIYAGTASTREMAMPGGEKSPSRRPPRRSLTAPFRQKMCSGRSRRCGMRCWQMIRRRLKRAWTRYSRRRSS